MDRTSLDELVDYPMKVCSEIVKSKKCLALILDKPLSQVTSQDVYKVLDENIYTYRYVDETTSRECAYIWVEADAPRVQNKRIKSMRVYITVVCSKGYMEIESAKFPQLAGNRRDNLARYIDARLNEKPIAGIGAFNLQSANVVLLPEKKFTGRVLVYETSDFNIKESP